jgi:hypothetical protein
MRVFVSTALLLVLAAPSFGQDPNQNRMNHPYPEPETREAVDRAPARTPGLSPFANRMNVEYGERVSAEVIGGPDRYANRMNAPDPKPVTEHDRAAEQVPVR